MKAQNIEDHLIELSDALENDFKKLGLKNNQYELEMDTDQRELKITTQDAIIMNRIGMLLKDVGIGFWNEQQLATTSVFFKYKQQIINNNNMDIERENQIGCSIQ